MAINKYRQVCTSTYWFILLHTCWYQKSIVHTRTYCCVNFTKWYVSVHTKTNQYIHQLIRNMVCQFTCTHWYILVCTATYQFIPYITISYHLVLSCSVWYCQVLPYTLLGTSCLNLVLSQYLEVPSTSLESCTPEQTWTKLNQTEQSLGTGPFRYTGFKVTAGTAWYWDEYVIIDFRTNKYIQAHTSTYWYILLHTCSYK